MKAIFFAMTMTASAVWFNPQGQITPRPQHTASTYNVTDAQLISDGWVNVQEPACDPKYWLIEGTTITEMSQEQKDAVDAAEAAQFAAYEAARGEAIAGQAGTAITTLAGLLDVFGLSMPLDFQEAMGTMYAASKQDASKTPDALLALITYNGLRESLSDRDIYLAARHLGLTAEQE